VTVISPLVYDLVGLLSDILRNLHEKNSVALNLYRLYFITFIFSISFTGIRGQEAFSIDWKKERAYWSGGLVANGIGYALFHNADPVDFDYVSSLDINSVNAFDRRAIFNNSARADFYSDIVGNGSVVLPLIIYLTKIQDKEWRHSSIMFLELAMFNFAINNITKYGFQRPRPYVYNAVLQPGETLSKTVRTSFVSGHTSFAASNSFFAAALFQRAYPDSPFVPYVYLTASAVPIATGIYRVRAGKHYYSDVIAGSITGAAVACLVVQLHKRDDIFIRSTNQGIGLVKVF